MRIFYCIILIWIVNCLAQDEIVCSLGNENINECVKCALTENFLKLHNPNKEAKFDTIDPFWFQFGQLNFNASEKVQGYFILQNVTLNGADKMTFEKLSVKTKENVMKISGLMAVPLIVYEGFHESNLKIEEYLISSQGTMNGTMEDVSGKFTAIGSIVDTDDGLKQLNVTSFDITLVIKTMKFNVIGLSKDETWNAFLNRIVNNSWQYLYQDLIEASKSLWEIVVVDVLNELFSFVKFQD